MQMAWVACCVSVALNTANAQQTNEQLVERITVKGQISSLAVDKQLDLSEQVSADFREQLSKLPGVSINGNGGVTGIVQYRGLFGDRVLMNIDGAEIIGAGPNAMDSPMSHIISDANLQVTLYQGIAPVSAGAEALGGALEINDFNVGFSSGKWVSNGNLHLSAYSNQGSLVSFNADIKNNDTYLAVSADSQQSNNLKASDDRIIPNTFYERTGVKLKAGYKQQNHQLDLLIGQRNTNESGTPALAMDIIFIDSLWYRLQHSYQHSDQLVFSTKLFGNQNAHVMDNYQLRNPPMPAMSRLNTVDSSANGLTFDTEYNNAGHVFKAGLSVQHQTHDSLIENPINDAFFLLNFNNVKRDRQSVFLEVANENKVKQINYSAGVRISKVNMHADAINSNMVMMNPNVASLASEFNLADKNITHSLYDVVAKASIPIFAHLDVVISAGFKQRAPSYQQHFTWFPLGISAGLADGRNYLGNLDLQKESLKGMDLGFVYQQKNTNLLLNLFYNRIQDYIIGLPTTNNAAINIATMNNQAIPLQWQNIDATIKGVDASVSYQVNRALSLHAGLQYARGKQTTPVEDDLYRLAPLSGQVQVQWQQGEFAANLSAKLVSEQKYVAELQNESITPGYSVIDTSAQWFINSQWQLTLSIHNLLDKAYIDHLGGVNRVSGQSVAVGEKLPATGRNFGVNVSYQF